MAQQIIGNTDVLVVGKAKVNSNFTENYNSIAAIESDVTDLTAAISGLASTAYADNAATTAANAKVAQTITDGVTTSAPSQDVVSDALALKANIASPAFTGTPTAPTQTLADNSKLYYCNSISE